MTRKKNERDLFGIVTQPRRQKPEPWPVYEAVLRARFKGATVIRQGRDRHLVKWPWADKRVVTTDKLLALFPPGPKPSDLIG